MYSNVSYLFFRTSKSFVKKKAALTLLRLYRKHPDVIPVTDWADRIVHLMDEHDLVKFLHKLCAIETNCLYSPTKGGCFECDNISADISAKLSCRV